MIVVNTAEAARTLKYLSAGSGNLSAARTWFSSQNSIYTDELSRTIIALSGEIDVSALVATLVSYRNADGGWGLTQNYPISNPYDTVLALQALKAVNYSDQSVINSALSYPLSIQNPDGGWGFYPGADSNVYVTALVLQTLSQFKGTYNLSTPINGAAAYLLDHQNPDSGFATSTGSVQGTSTVYETALALIALIESNPGQTPSTSSGFVNAVQSAINYLISTQLPDGSWDEDPYSTALALRALAMVKPNLSISASDITFSNPAPTVGVHTMS